jgi:hypothetical protein
VIAKAAKAPIKAPKARILGVDKTAPTAAPMRATKIRTGASVWDCGKQIPGYATAVSRGWRCIDQIMRDCMQSCKLNNEPLACPEVRYILRIATTGEIDAARSAGHSTAIWPSSMTMTAAMIV